MGHRLVDSTGYPLGDLYMLFRAMEPNPTEEKDRRRLFELLGVPTQRMLSAVPTILGWVDIAWANHFKRDYDLGLNLPEDLNKD